MSSCVQNCVPGRLSLRPPQAESLARMVRALEPARNQYKSIVYLFLSWDWAFIGSFIPSAEIVPGLTFPGDVDVLVIPYEGDELVLSHALAIEIKVIRASFARQGKSPNQFGFSQAGALLEAGFPHVAVGHLIISGDRSPEDAWRKQMMTKIVDADGACGPFQPVRCDMLPSDLLQRSHGRLRRNRPDPRLGHFSAFPCRSGTWLPEGERAALNPHTRLDVLEGIHAYYQKHGRHFLRTRRHPLVDPVALSDSERALQFEQMVEKMRRDFP